MYSLRYRYKLEINDSVKLCALVIVFLFVCSCTSHAMGAVQEQAHSTDDFYSGLTAESTEEKIRLFENSLLNQNAFIRQAAAEQLAVLMTRGAAADTDSAELSDATLELVRREVSRGGWWAGAFDAVDNLPDRNKVLSFLSSFEQNNYSFYDEPRLYVLQECEKQNFTFSESETAVIDGHFEVSRMRYNAALASFHRLRTNNGITAQHPVWPDQMPQIFFDYPNLINDLGRAFQYTSSSGNEGLNLFLQWESALPDNASLQSSDLRYRLLFFAARVARRMGQSAQAVTLFERALSFAPDTLQQDASIWYILDLSLSGQISVIMERIEKYIPQMKTGSTYNDIMERFLHRLVAAQDWNRIIKTFNLIKNIDGLYLKAGYAWVIARAIEENYLSNEQRRLAAAAADISAADVSSFMRIAYNASDTLLMPAPYYRMLSAAYLNLPFMEFADNAPVSGGAEQSQVLKFLLGFFSNDAAEQSVPYIRSMEGILSPDELRAVAQALDERDMYMQSMRLIQLYINNDGYAKNRRDLEIMYPRPFLELIETHGRMFSIAPSLLFGLIRQESAFQEAIVSSAGAVGLMQLMQATARDMADRIRRSGGPNFLSANGSVDSTNAAANVYIGSYYYNYLRNLLNGNDQLSLMSYNAGMTRIRRWYNASSLPVDLFVETITIYETRDYGRRIPALARIYEEIYYR